MAVSGFEELAGDGEDGGGGAQLTDQLQHSTCCQGLTICDVAVLELFFW